MIKYYLYLSIFSKPLRGIELFGYYGANKRMIEIYDALKRYAGKLDKDFEVILFWLIQEKKPQERWTR